MFKQTKVAVPASITISKDAVIQSNFRDQSAWLQGPMGKDYLVSLFGEALKEDYIRRRSPEAVKRLADAMKARMVDHKKHRVTVTSDVKEATTAIRRKRKGAPTSTLDFGSLGSPDRLAPRKSPRKSPKKSPKRSPKAVASPKKKASPKKSPTKSPVRTSPIKSPKSSPGAAASALLVAAA